MIGVIAYFAKLILLFIVLLSRLQPLSSHALKQTYCLHHAFKADRGNFVTSFNVISKISHSRAINTQTGTNQI
jgi:hypothetical protein